MPPRIQIQPHLSLEELEESYRKASEGRERSHYYIIWQLAQGKSTAQVAELTGYSRSWLYELVWGYNRIGPASLGDKRHQNQGAKPLLNEVQQAQLWQALQERSSDGGLWTGPKVAAWMSELLGRQVAPQRGWEYLRSLEFRRRRPRPAHVKSSLSEQQQWKRRGHGGRIQFAPVSCPYWRRPSSK